MLAGCRLKHLAKLGKHILKISKGFSLPDAVFQFKITVLLLEKKFVRYVQVQNLHKKNRDGLTPYSTVVEKKKQKVSTVETEIEAG